MRDRSQTPGTSTILSAVGEAANARDKRIAQDTEWAALRERLADFETWRQHVTLRMSELEQQVKELTVVNAAGSADTGGKVDGNVAGDNLEGQTS